MTRAEVCRDCDRHDIVDGRDSCELVGTPNDTGKIVPSCCALRRMWADESAKCPDGKWNGAAVVPLPVVEAGISVAHDALTTLVSRCLGGCKHHVKPWRCASWSVTNIKSLVQSGMLPDGKCPRYQAVVQSGR